MLFSIIGFGEDQRKWKKEEREIASFKAEYRRN